MGVVLELLKREYVVLALFLLTLGILPQVPNIPLCPFAAFLHHSCPTCGVVRGLWHLMHGHFLRAWDLNPISYLIIALCARRLLGWLSIRKWAVFLDSKPIDFVFLGLFFWFGFSKFLGFQTEMPGEVHPGTYSSTRHGMLLCVANPFGNLPGGGRRHRMTPAKAHLAMAAMGKPDTVVNQLCWELGVTRQTLYRYVSPSGELRAHGKKVLKPMS